MHPIAQKPAVLLACAVAAILVIGSAALSVRTWRTAKLAEAGLDRRMAAIVAAAAPDLAPCSEVAAPDAIVVLAMGQSNAANHGAPGATSHRVPMVTAEGCVWASDPLPGGTGLEASVWSELPSAVTAHPGTPPLLLSLLAVESSSIGEWTHPHSPLNARLRSHLEGLRQRQRPPVLILWDQGAADARLGTAPEAYRQGLLSLAATIEARLGSVRMLLARSTVCRSAPATALREVVKHLAETDPRFGLGPDLDQALLPSHRLDGCHLSPTGRVQGAALWAAAIAGEVSSHRPGGPSAPYGTRHNEAGPLAKVGESSTRTGTSDAR